jgi:chemotaxis signal transduction protein
MYKKGVMPVINLATLLLMEQPHINSLKNLPPIPITQNNQIVVLKDGNNGDHIGLLVDQLGEIPEVPEEQIEKLSAIMGGETQLADSMVKKREGDSGNQMLVLLSVDRVRARLQALHAQIDPNAVS